jgi:hypothetical protein
MTYERHATSVILGIRLCCIAAMSLVVGVAAAIQPMKHSVKPPRPCKAQNDVPSRPPLWAPIIVQIRIEIPSSCGAANDIYAIINGDDKNPKLLKPDLTTGDSVSVFDWPDKRAQQFPRAPLFASLRFGHARTYCRWAKRDERSLLLVALFKFPCDDQPVHQVTVDADSSDDSSSEPLSYVRAINENPSGEDDGLECDYCFETGKASGSTKVDAVLFPSERLLLQLGYKRPDSEAPGLLVYSANPGIPGLFSSDPKTGDLVIRPGIKKPEKAKNPRKPEKRLSGLDNVVAITLARPEIVKGLFVRRLKNVQFSSAELAIDEEALKTLTSVYVSVKR